MPGVFTRQIKKKIIQIETKTPEPQITYKKCFSIAMIVWGEDLCTEQNLSYTINELCLIHMMEFVA